MITMDKTNNNRKCLSAGSAPLFLFFSVNHIIMFRGIRGKKELMVSGKRTTDRMSRGTSESSDAIIQRKEPKDRQLIRQLWPSLSLLVSHPFCPQIVFYLELSQRDIPETTWTLPNEPSEYLSCFIGKEREVEDRKWQHDLRILRGERSFRHLCV